MFRLSSYRVGIASFFSLGLLALLSSSSKAACLTNGCHQHGLVFSEASSNFKITDVTGTGTATDPFVVFQDVWGLDISLAIDGLTNARQHSVFQRPGFAISVVSRNLTGAFWRFYDHELQEIAGVASHENDGLSFAQGIGPARPYTSSHYHRADEITDVRDFINFYRGDGVNPGESVRFDYFVTDTIPNQTFYIRQRPDYRPNTVPTSAIASQPPVAQTSPPQTLPPSSPASSPAEPAQQQPPVELESAEELVTSQPNSQPEENSVSSSQASIIPAPQAVPEPAAGIMGSVIVLLYGLHKRGDKRKP